MITIPLTETNQVGEPEHLLQEEVEIEEQLATLENKIQRLEIQLQEQVQLRSEVTSQAEEGGSQTELLSLMEQEEQQIQKQIDDAAASIVRIQQKKEEIAHQRETIQGLNEELQPSKYPCCMFTTFSLVCDDSYWYIIICCKYTVVSLWCEWLSSGLLREAKECGEHFQRKDNSKPQPEMQESHSENIEEGKDEWDAEMREWIELHKRDVLVLDNGEHHILLISSYTCTCTFKICQLNR